MQKRNKRRNFTILTADSCTVLFFLCPSKGPSVSRRTLRKRATDKSCGIYSRAALRTMVCRKTDGSLANRPHVGFWRQSKMLDRRSFRKCICFNEIFTLAKSKFISLLNRLRRPLDMRTYNNCWLFS